MVIYRGDTFLQKIKAENYTFEIGDKLHIAIMNNEYSKNYLYETIIEIKEKNDSVNLEISADDTSKFEIGDLLLEVELTTISGIVKTNQYELQVKADGIYERN